MMHGRGKSDSAIVAEKPVNKAVPTAAELVEPRAGAKGNVCQQSTCRAQDRVKRVTGAGAHTPGRSSGLALRTRGKSRMHQRARTDLRGGRGVTPDPTATVPATGSRRGK